MTAIVQRAAPVSADEYPRTDWFKPDVYPTIEGEYEARTGGGHIFRRRWTAHGWINSITNLPSTAPLDWRGIVPGAVEIKLYSLSMRHVLTGLPFA